MRVISLIFLLLSISLPAGAVDPFRQLGEAVRMTNYSGVMVYQQGERMETLRIVHRYSEGIEHERLLSLSGEPVEFLRQGAAITCIVPRDREVMVDMRNYAGLFPSLPEEAPKAFESGLYTASETEGVEVLQRSCRRVQIKPMDAYRYGYQLWVDQETGLPLKYQLRDHDGEVLEQAMFTEIDFPTRIPDAALAATLDTAGFVQIKHEPMPMPEKSLAEGRWEAAMLPPGFMLVDRQIKRMPDAMGKVEHIVYSDGMASVSVYVASSDEKLEPFMGETRMGATSAYGAMHGEHHIAVVGEVPNRTVQLIGRGMRISARK